LPKHSLLAEVYLVETFFGQYSDGNMTLGHNVPDAPNLVATCGSEQEIPDVERHIDWVNKSRRQVQKGAKCWSKVVHGGYEWQPNTLVHNGSNRASRYEASVTEQRCDELHLPVDVICGNAGLGVGECADVVSGKTRSPRLISSYRKSC
jgi:hypothetical protein